MYDIIGDVHGHADRLEALLSKMGYAGKDGVWQHSERTLISVGDLVDRGWQEQSRAVLDVAKEGGMMGYQFRSRALSNRHFYSA